MLKINPKAMKFGVLILFLLITITSNAKVNKKEINLHKNYVIILTTNFGDVKFMLLNETPLHRDNFIKLIDAGFYNGVLFHRVVNEFVIQGGDPNPSNTINKNLTKIDTTNIPAEIIPQFFHYRGAVGAAREGENNPEKESSYSNFYIVQKTATLSKMQTALEKASKKNKIDKLVKSRYLSRGGTPHLDGNYTIFGYVLTGMDIVDNICQVSCAEDDVPKEDVIIEKIEYKKINRRKIDKKYIHYAK